MKTAMATVSISGTLPEKIAAIAAAGFQGIEIFEPDLTVHDEAPEVVARRIADAGLELTMLQPFRDFEGLPAPLRAAAFDRAERKFDLMTRLGAPQLLICSNCSPAALGGIDRAADDLRDLADRAAARGVRLCYEALAWGRHISDHRDAWEVVRRADHPALGLIIDSFHTLSRGLDPETIRAIPGDRLAYVHLADAPWFATDLLWWSRHLRAMPGQGDLNVQGFLRAVAATGYDGWISLEIFNDQFRGGAARSIARDGQRSLRVLMDEARRTEPESRLTAPAMPARVPAHGFEFVEFTSEGAEATALKTALGQLGFAQAGSHRSKPVTLWRQGEINLVVNEATDGQAASAFALHGTSVCDIGLKVADAAAVRDRAAALLADRFDPALPSGDMTIPAVRAPGGGVLHFLDDGPALGNVWSAEFGARPGGDGAGLTRIDHLAVTMAYDEMLTHGLFYTSVLDLHKSGITDVIDPGGLVRSQVLESPDRRFRLTMNGADSHRTVAGRMLTEASGSSVSHIAMATDDIFATARALKQAGFQPLEIPANYYDDLEARLDIDPTLAADLRAANILLEQDGDAVFLQLYSRTLGERFFFEIVERRGGYQGYGALNAPVRTAAQRRSMRAAAMPRL